MNNNFNGLYKDGQLTMTKNTNSKETIEIPLVKATYEELQEVICELQAEKFVKDKEIARLNKIIDELEKCLKEKQTLYGINQQAFSWGVAGDCLDKLKELKEEGKE